MYFERRIKLSEFNDINNEEITEETSAPQKTLGREILEWILSIVIALVIAFTLRNYVVIFARVDGESMLPTLHHNERLIVWRLGYEPENGDVVILDPPSGRGPYVKRIIATEGQTLRIDNVTGDVFVDGEKIDEPYINNKTYSFQQEFVVPEGYTFVMGDNRQNSHDSRSQDVGFIKNKSIYGEVVLRIWPLDMLGTVD